MHLLLLDDDDLSNKIVSMVLQDLSIVKTVTVYTDGWDVLQFLEKNKEHNFPDLF